MYIGLEMPRDTTILIRLTKEEKAHFNAVAVASGESISVWIRQALRAASNMNQQIGGPCSYCGAADHWRPDCEKLRADTMPPRSRHPSDVAVGGPSTEEQPMSIPAASNEVGKMNMDAVSGREVVPEPTEMVIPEIPVSGQNLSSTGQPIGPGVSDPEPAAESGRIVDGEWIPD